MNVFHVLPIDDLIEHDDITDDCICGPSVEFVEGGMMIVHNSLDGRELEEAGRNECPQGKT